MNKGWEANALDVQISPQEMTKEKEKPPTDEELLQIAIQSSTLRVVLVLLALVLIIFTIMKICKLAYQIRFLCREEKEAKKSTSGIPQIIAQSRTAVTEASNQRKYSKSKYSIPSKNMEVKMSLSNESEPSHSSSKDMLYIILTLFVTPLLANEKTTITTSKLITITQPTATSVKTESKGTTTDAISTTTSIAKCIDKSSNCVSYQLCGLCTSPSNQIRQLMEDLCPSTCGFCDCKDKMSDCSSFTWFCFVPEFQSMMLAKCKKTCRLCSMRACFDEVGDCILYSHLCDVPQFEAKMRERCAATCGFCN